MADTERQKLIHLHTSTSTSMPSQLELGEIAVQHTSENGSQRIWIKTGSTDMTGVAFAPISYNDNIYVKKSDANPGLLKEFGTGETITSITQSNGVVTIGTGVTHVAAANVAGLETVINAQMAGLKKEVDDTQAGAGLADDGKYSANTSTQYLKEATSLKDADEKLDSAIWNLAQAIAGGVNYRGLTGATPETANKGDLYVANTQFTVATGDGVTSLVEKGDFIICREPSTGYWDVIEGSHDGVIVKDRNADLTTGTLVTAASKDSISSLPNPSGNRILVYGTSGTYGNGINWLELSKIETKQYINSVDGTDSIDLTVSNGELTASVLKIDCGTY